MHVPDKWNMSDTGVIHSFIEQHGFAVLVSNDLNASHLPLILKSDEAEKGVLYGHFARANSHWKTVIGQSILCIFNGPHGYISPTWYDSYPAVPTWNYSSVHVKGTVELTDDESTLSILELTIRKYEPSLLGEQTFIPIEYQQKLSQGIVGFKIVIDDIQGQQKLGQHRSAADQQGVAAGLLKSASMDHQQLLSYMVENNIGLGL